MDGRLPKQPPLAHTRRARVEGENVAAVGRLVGWSVDDSQRVPGRQAQRAAQGGPGAAAWDAVSGELSSGSGPAAVQAPAAVQHSQGAARGGEGSQAQPADLLWASSRRRMGRLWRQSSVMTRRRRDQTHDHCQNQSSNWPCADRPASQPVVAVVVVVAIAAGLVTTQGRALSTTASSYTPGRCTRCTLAVEALARPPGTDASKLPWTAQHSETVCSHARCIVGRAQKQTRHVPVCHCQPAAQHSELSKNCCESLATCCSRQEAAHRPPSPQTAACALPRPSYGPHALNPRPTKPATASP